MEQLLKDIDAFLDEFPMKESYFGYLAARNTRLLERLRNGKEILPRTENRVRLFMEEYREARGASASKRDNAEHVAA